MAKTTNACVVCGNSDLKTVYIKCVKEGADAVICATCLPEIVHAGGHCH